MFSRPAALPASNHFSAPAEAILAPEYRFLFQEAQIAPSFQKDAAAAAQLAMRQMSSLYQPVAGKLGIIPWWAIACIHHMECGGNPAGGIANGQPWNAVTTEVPAGHGPFASFLDEAIAAIKGYETPDQWGQNLASKNWNDAGWAFWFFESWNGFGERENKGGITTPPNASPYIYSGAQLPDGTLLYAKGKDTSDYNFDPKAVSSQVGCMAFMKALNALGAGAML